MVSRRNTSFLKSLPCKEKILDRQKDFVYATYCVGNRD